MNIEPFNKIYTMLQNLEIQITKIQVFGYTKRDIQILKNSFNEILDILQNEIEI